VAQKVEAGEEVEAGGHHVGDNGSEAAGRQASIKQVAAAGQPNMWRCLINISMLFKRISTCTGTVLNAQCVVTNVYFHACVTHNPD
jgi:hypothetical protein